MDSEKQTCLYERHVALGALMEPFAGFVMPIQYSSIMDEHEAVRKHCGVFDVSHMGEVVVTGADSLRFVNHIFTNDVSALERGKIQYGMMCYPDGGTVDDLLVYKVNDERFFIVINAANDEKDTVWMREQSAGYAVEIDHQSERYGQLAVQGPESEAVMQQVLGLECAELSFYTFKTLDVEGETIVVSRTGYTGEDGFEVYASPKLTRRFWDILVESGRCKPCGLGCRDTLRFEVGLPLYGDELSAEISPIMAGLGIFCKLDKAEFIGKDALARQKAEGTPRRLVGIELKDKAVPRHGYKVMKDGREVGEVTTGYRSISTGKSVCMALVDWDCRALGTEVAVQIRKRTFPGTVVKKKFYEKHYKK